MAPVIHWFRRDLRLADNTALENALLSADPVLPLFILDDYILDRVAVDDPRRAQLAAALGELDTELRGRGSRLLVRAGDAARELNHVAEEVESWGVYFNRDYTPYARQRDTRATRGLQLTGVVTQVFDDRLLVSPHDLVGDDLALPGRFEDFRGEWLEALELEPEAETEPEVAILMPEILVPESVAGWRERLIASATPAAKGGAANARDQLRRFVADLLPGYGSDTGGAAADLGGLEAALRYGTISVRDTVRAVLRRAAADPRARPGAERFVEDLARREFAVHRRFADPSGAFSA